MEIAVIGAGGFVGAAFIRQLHNRGYRPEEVRRETFGQHHAKQWDLVVDAASNSRKYLAEKEPYMPLFCLHLLFTLKMTLIFYCPKE
jgi:nucleoside-diphosphate-sugar epimerase